ncbi:hypothetical protein O6H91_01G141500 [Diphasiastrum complanatum]|uniref:Uncharacterized protein n=1 Tax=Diphasiastrum complanatum TaxID=34168 RepID=A0ACC2EWW0_DIPCM|nr:hypothetical protein O6H91_01G141500 [Diphasiastrum complanatum]
MTSDKSIMSFFTRLEKVKDQLEDTGDDTKEVELVSNVLSVGLTPIISPSGYFFVMSRDRAPKYEELEGILAQVEALRASTLPRTLKVMMMQLLYDLQGEDAKALKFQGKEATHNPKKGPCTFQEEFNSWKIEELMEC